jgi:hypothetical protein
MRVSGKAPLIAYDRAGFEKAVLTAPITAVYSKPAHSGNQI